MKAVLLWQIKIDHQTLLSVCVCGRVRDQFTHSHILSGGLTRRNITTSLPLPGLSVFLCPNPPYIFFLTSFSLAFCHLFFVTQAWSLLFLIVKSFFTPPDLDSSPLRLASDVVSSERGDAESSISTWKTETGRVYRDWGAITRKTFSLCLR